MAPEDKLGYITVLSVGGVTFSLSLPVTWLVSEEASPAGATLLCMILATLASGLLGRGVYRVAFVGMSWFMFCFGAVCSLICYFVVRCLKGEGLEGVH